mmetsp:Transcript_19710/g.25982  ORF Transcript_19710/g.25982 Transcript_19710/m.25982 type:complete len:116 (-) Transcript_19710:98-445(-)
MLLEQRVNIVIVNSKVMFGCGGRGHLIAQCPNPERSLSSDSEEGDTPCKKSKNKAQRKRSGRKKKGYISSSSSESHSDSESSEVEIRRWSKKGYNEKQPFFSLISLFYDSLCICI